MTSTSSSKRAASGRATAGMALVMAMAFAIVATNAAITFSGSPTINYDAPFYMYTAVWNSYCALNGTGTSAEVMCNIGVTDPAQATKFAISGGCGPVPASSLIRLAMYVPPTASRNYTRWCHVMPPSADVWVTLRCNETALPPAEFSFVNINATSDGYLHGNASAVTFTDSSNGVNTLCSAQSIYINGADVLCNRETVSSWETFNFVPA